MSSTAQNQVAKCYNKMAFSSWELIFKISFSESLQCPLHLQRYSPLSFHGTILTNTKMCIRMWIYYMWLHTVKPQHPKELCYFFMLSSKQAPLQTFGRWTLNCTAMCRMQRNCTFPLGTQYPWLPPFFIKHAMCKINKGNLDVKPRVCSPAQKCTEGNNTMQSTADFSRHLPSWSRPKSEERRCKLKRRGM